MDWLTWAVVLKLSFLMCAASFCTGFVVHIGRK